MKKKNKESVKMLFFLAIASLTGTSCISLSSSFGAFNAVFHYTWELLVKAADSLCFLVVSQLKGS